MSIKGLTTDIQVVVAELYLLPVRMRVPLKFGAETLTEVTCARVKLLVVSRNGQRAVGWGETPLSVPWVWPSELSYSQRSVALEEFCGILTEAWVRCEFFGHPMEIGNDFLDNTLPKLQKDFNQSRAEAVAMPHLAALVCCSPFDIALHDAFGQLVKRPVYETYTAEYMNRDLSHFLEAASDSDCNFHGKYPVDFLELPPKTTLPVWHLVGGLDPLKESDEFTDPGDGHPVLLNDWIERDGLRCLKVKLRGNDAAWDFERLVQVGQISQRYGETHLTADFNCMVTDPEYVNQILDLLQAEYLELYNSILYVEQPFPYDLEANRIDVHSVSKRKPLLMDESAHDWRLVRLGKSLGWNGVALKTCKTQTGAILSLCWAKAHDMYLMVQDLTNPMLAQLPHVQLAAHADTMMGVESNGMQFYPEASTAEAELHPGLYQRREGKLDLSTIRGPGFGYRLDEIARELPSPVVVASADEAP